MTPIPLKSSRGIIMTAREEYSRQRDAIRKRVRRLEQAGYTEHPLVQKWNEGNYPRLKEIDARGEPLRNAKRRAERALENKQNTLSSVRAKEKAQEQKKQQTQEKEKTEERKEQPKPKRERPKPFDDYRLGSLRKKSEKELRAEYKRLWNAMKRKVKALEKAGYTDNPLVEAFKSGQFHDLKTIDFLGEDLAKELKHLAHKVNASTSTVEGYEHRLDTLVGIFREKDWNFVNRKNVMDFKRFLDDVKEIYGNLRYDSGVTVEVYKEYVVSGRMDSKEALRRFSELAETISKNLNETDAAPQKKGNGSHGRRDT